MKYDNTHFYQSPRIFWPSRIESKYDNVKHVNIYKATYGENDKYIKYHALSVNAKWLYQTLKECEHRFTGAKNDSTQVIFEGVENTKNWFYAGTDKLVFMSGMSKSSVRRARKELIDVGLVRTCNVFFVRDGKKTSRHTYGYFIFGETELEWAKIEDDCD